VVVDELHVEERNWSEEDACKVPVKKLHSVLLGHVESAAVTSSGELRQINPQSESSRHTKERHLWDQG
jgi:hypothetical protein